MLSQQQKNDFERDGFVILRRFVDASIGARMEAETVAAIRADPPSVHSCEPAYVLANGMLVQPEGKVPDRAVDPDDYVAKVFNAHLAGTAHDFAVGQAAGDIVASLIGEDIDASQSMFMRTRDPRGDTPLRYQAAYCDPKGRSLALELRRAF